MMNSMIGSTDILHYERNTKHQIGNQLIQQLQQRHRTNVKNSERNLNWWTSPDIWEDNAEHIFRCAPDNFMTHQLYPACYDWSKKGVDDWLSLSGYTRYRNMFRLLNIDGKMLAHLDPHNLRRMGVGSWEDCRGLVETAQPYTQRRAVLDPSDFQHKIYPYYPSLYVDEHPDRAQSIQKLRKPVYRTIYNSSDNTFFHYDKYLA